MNAIGIGALIVFLLAWLGGVVAWFVCAFHIIAYWIDSFRGRRGRHPVKALKAAGVFLGFWMVLMTAGLIGAWWGNWMAGHS